MTKKLDPKLQIPPEPEPKDKLPRRVQDPKFGDRFADLPPIGFDDEGERFSER